MDDWIGRANLFDCPLGAEPGRGAVLMAGEDFENLDLDTTYDLTFDVTNATGEGTSPVTLKNLVIVRALCAVAGSDPDSEGSTIASDAPYLIELADRRQLYRGIPIDKAYNLRYGVGASEFFPGTRNAGSDWTWQTLVTDIWTIIGKLGTGSTLPFTPDGTPEGFDFYGSSAWDALDTVLTRIGCALKLDPLTDAFSIVRLADDDTDGDTAIQNEDKNRYWDDRPLDGHRGLIPEKVRVHFPKLPCVSAGVSPWYTKDETDGESSGAEEGSYALIYDQMSALYDSTGTLTNGTALDARALERATDYFREMHQAPLHKVFIGPQTGGGQLVPRKTVRAVRWEDRGTGYKTELIWFPVRPREQKTPLRCLEVGLCLDFSAAFEMHACGTGTSSPAGSSGGGAPGSNILCLSFSAAVEMHACADAADSGGSGVTVRKNSGADVGTRPRLNYIEGDGITLTVTDDSGDDEVDIEIAATGGAGTGIAGNGSVSGTGTTTDSYVSILDVSSTNGVLGTVGINNTGATWALNFRVTIYSVWGSSIQNAQAVTAFALASKSIEQMSIAGGLAGPWDRVTVEVQTNNPGNHTTYSLKSSLVLV